MTTEQKNDIMWKLAKKRACFKQSLFTYFFINLFLTGVWYFTTGPYSYFWPVWSILGWGIGIAFQYFEAYHKIFSAETEYEILKKQNQ